MILRYDRLFTHYERLASIPIGHVLVNHRYNHRLPMVITTNELPTDLDQRLQSRLFDRGRNCVFEILAGDYRMRGV